MGPVKVTRRDERSYWVMVPEVVHTPYRRRDWRVVGIVTRATRRTWTAMTVGGHRHGPFPTRRDAVAVVVGPRVRYIVHPGTVMSRNDRDRHFISAPRLAALYGVRDYVVVDDDRPGFRAEPGDVHLYPRFDGDYRLPTAGPIDGRHI